MLNMDLLRELDPEGAADFEQFARCPTWEAFAGLEARTYRRLGPLIDSDKLSFEQLGKVRDVLRGFAEIWTECPDPDIRADYQSAVDYYNGKGGRFAELVRARRMGVR
ncbi:MAG: hypothetical protein WB715_10530 [Roseiarcus sp.]|uniref:hypothetical protein n=1 Tax=Roseiarcus sp. TaxID=1969460 RepID=UPI003C58ED92